MDDITTLPLVITIHFLHYIFKLLTAENLVAFESDRERRVLYVCERAEENNVHPTYDKYKLDRCEILFTIP